MLSWGEMASEWYMLEGAQHTFQDGAARTNMEMGCATNYLHDVTHMPGDDVAGEILPRRGSLCRERVKSMSAFVHHRHRRGL